MALSSSIQSTTIRSSTAILLLPADISSSSFSACSSAYSAAISNRSSVLSCNPFTHHQLYLRPVLGVRAQHNSELRNHPQYAAGTVPAPVLAPAEDQLASAYTSMRADPLGFWDTHKGLSRHINFHENTGSLLKELEAEEDEALFLAAELRLLVNAASDRAEMHSILAQQRDNWNKLFQHTLTAATMTACMLSGLDSQAHSLGLSVPALLLSATSAAMMAIINQFQPSQLAEEQRTAARLFRKLASDIHYALHVAPHLRQDLPSLLRDCQRRLQALDKAFPMPLTPGGLEKFPTKVLPPILRAAPPSCPGHDDHHDVLSSTQNIDNQSNINYNGWDKHLTQDLQRVAGLLHCSDIPKYVGWAQNLVKVNRCLAFAAPVFAASAAVLNAIAISTCSTMLPANIWGMWAAVCCVLATFANSFSNDMQMGMVFELYRNSAGYYADVEALIKETLVAPVQQRENGALFRQRIAYLLGRWPDTASTSCTSIDSSSLPPIVPTPCEEAGTLF